MKISMPTYYYPNQMGRIIFQAMEEVIGHNGVNTILGLASFNRYVENYPPDNNELGVPFEVVSGTMAALEEMYGPRGGRGLALRVGRASFQYGLRDFGPLFGLTDMTFRLLPLQTKLKVGANSFAEIFNKHSDQRVHVEHDEKHLYWHIDRCPVCWGRHTDVPVCYLAVGILQEALYWVSGGKFFHVEQTGCIASGDPSCTIVIDKNPLS
jgi:predicted hydrocarbon binding protein